MKLFSWAELTEIATSGEPTLPMKIRAPHAEAQADLEAVSISSEGDDLVFIQKPVPGKRTLHIAPPMSATRTRIHIFDVSSLDSDTSGPATQPASSLLSQQSPLSYVDSPLDLDNLFPKAPLSLLPISPLSSARDLSMHRRFSGRDVADIPDFESIIGTVNKFNSWFLIFILRSGWVCSVALSRGIGKAVDTFQKHFFIPSVLRTGNRFLITKVRCNQDIIFVHQDGVIVVKNGLDNGEHVPFHQLPYTNGLTVQLIVGEYG